MGFKFYVANFGNYTATYGAIGGVMVLMLWFYISGVVILFGAEMNAEIEHASPYGKDEGEKVPGQKRKIGPAAMRAWMARHRGGGKEGPKPPSAEELKAQVGATPPDKDPAAAHSDAPAPRPVPQPVPQPVMRPAMSSSMQAAPAGGGVTDYLIGAGVVAAQAFFALQFWKKSRA